MLADPNATKENVYLLFQLLYCKERVKSKQKGKCLINNWLLESSICKCYTTRSNNLLLFISCLWCHCSTIATISIPFHNPYSSNIYVNNTLQKLKTSFTFNAGFVLIRHRKEFAYSQLHSDSFQSEMLFILNWG